MNFEKLYHDHKVLVYNLALQYVQNSEEAEEITQDVFVTVHQSIETFKQQSKISTWIYRITINKSLDFIKSRQRKKRFGFMTSLFFENSHDIRHDLPVFDHPGILMENKETMKNIFRHINELPDKQKTALILNKIEGKSQSEISEIMGLNIKAVESLVLRAKTNLSKKLK